MTAHDRLMLLLADKVKLLLSFSGSIHERQWRDEIDAACRAAEDEMRDSMRIPLGSDGTDGCD